jgi:hypothetical protein
MRVRQPIKYRHVWRACAYYLRNRKRRSASQCAKLIARRLNVAELDQIILKPTRMGYTTQTFRDRIVVDLGRGARASFPTNQLEKIASLLSKSSQKLDAVAKRVAKASKSRRQKRLRRASRKIKLLSAPMRTGSVETRKDRRKSWGDYHDKEIFPAWESTADFMKVPDLVFGDMAKEGGPTNPIRNAPSAVNGPTPIASHFLASAMRLTHVVSIAAASQ